MYLCITNRHLCRGDFLETLEKAAKRADVEKIILREKDLSPVQYCALAQKCLEICNLYQKPLVVNQFIPVAKQLSIAQIQISFPLFQQQWDTLSDFTSIGVSVHSIEQAQQAQQKGADYLIAGHIFDTDCKKGVPGRGLSFLEKVCSSVSIPVYAIGGISPKCISQVLKAGAIGGCMMSGFMKE